MCGQRRAFLYNNGQEHAIFLTTLTTNTEAVQTAIFTLNTVVLISILIIAELVHSELPKEKRPPRQLFYPFILAAITLLVLAVVQKFGGA